jgi:hypothetical protein
MLTEKKPKKLKKPKKTSSDKIEYEENLQSMKSWVRKIEQTTLSVSSRLAAIERRISGQAENKKLNILGTTNQNRPLQNIIKNLDKSESKQNLVELSTAINDEVLILENQIIKQDAELAALIQTQENLLNELKEIKDYLDSLESSQTTLGVDLASRIEYVERRAPPVMKLGNKEVPIEVTGVIGGLLMFVITILVLAGQKDVLISPVFLAIIGFILIISAILKTLKLSTTNTTSPHLFQQNKQQKPTAFTEEYTKQQSFENK